MRVPYRLFALMLAGGLLTACASSPPSTFYTLAAGQSSAAPVPATPLFIEMLPVSVPERLARPQVVLRNNTSQLDIREQDRWASPFNFELRDALAAGIVSHSGATDVTKGGRPPQAITYRVAIDLQQYDAVMGQEVRTVFGWTIARSDGKKNLVCKLAVNEPVRGGSVAAVVGSMQGIVAHVSNTVAANIIALDSNQAPACTNK